MERKREDRRQKITAKYVYSSFVRTSIILLKLKSDNIQRQKVIHFIATYHENSCQYRWGLHISHYLCK